MKYTTALGLVTICVGPLAWFAFSASPQHTLPPAAPSATSTSTPALAPANSTPAPAPTRTHQGAKPAAPAPAAPQQATSTSSPAPSTSATAEAAPAPLAQLTVVAQSTTTYAIVAPDGTSLIDAMRVLQKDGLAFTSRDYQGLGAFVDSIQGIKNENGMYWILSINGSKSSHGALSVVLHQGDQIEWRYEQGY